MVNVAIPGGTGKLGLTIAEVLKDNPKHKITVLSRKATSILDGQVPVVAVDYENTADLMRVLKENEIHTVVCTMKVNSPESGQAELNLIQASTQCPHTKRFIVSEWAAPVLDPKLQLPQDIPRNASKAAVAKTDLEWAVFNVGFIADPFGTPHLKSHMGVYGIHVDMVNMAASIPGTGNEPLSFSYSYDIARFVEAALDLPHWDTSLNCYSFVATYNEAIRVAEEARGGKFTVLYDSVERLQAHQVSEIPFHREVFKRLPEAAVKRRFASFGLLVVTGQVLLPEDKCLNKVFPQIKTKTLSDMIDVWKGR